MAKFRDPDTEEVIDVVEMHMSFKNGEKIYKDKYGKQLVNEAGKPLIEIPRSEWDPNYDPTAMPTVMSFDMKSPEQKKASLKERSSAHFKKKIRENQANMMGETGKQS